MSGDFPKFPELQFLREWFSVWPGDCASRNHADAEAILARNVACTPIAAVHVEAHWRGANNGESGV